MKAIPQNASTVILLRDKEPQGFEVFLLRRHEKSSFMGGNFVYPGGRVDRGDTSSAIGSLSKGMTFDDAQRVLGGTLSREESFAHWIAGIRELFEEAGILLAYDEKGKLLQTKTREEQQRFNHYRTLLQKGKITLYEMAKKEKILFALDQLHYYAHWITPEARTERFDTRFFLARHPSGQEASHDQQETTVGIWLTPKKALEENKYGEVSLSPPTLKTLEDLLPFNTVDQVLHSLKSRAINPILPFLINLSGQPVIILPWDPDYALFKRGEIPSVLHLGEPSELNDETTRLILKNGRWHPYCRKG